MQREGFIQKKSNSFMKSYSKRFMQVASQGTYLVYSHNKIKLSDKRSVPSGVFDIRKMKDIKKISGK